MKVIVNYGQYRITIPKELAESKGWKAGTILRFVEDLDGNVSLKEVKKEDGRKTK